jgi:(S)-2-hydroxyglutarate dehydrogenase
MTDRAGAVVVGAGVLGLATARALQGRRPDLRVVVLDKEPTVAGHQSGHNSGVVHAGLYYAPGSLKARLTSEGRSELLAWCDHHDVPWQRCGKVIVATTLDEVGRLGALAERAQRNGIEATRLDPSGLADHEPHAAGLAALHVPSTAIIDYRAVCLALARQVTDNGGAIMLATRFVGIDHDGPEIVVRTSSGSIRTTHLANCAGLASDRVAHVTGDPSTTTILPFRGEYHELVASRRHLVRGLIYPVPDPRFPFLGVHLTRTIDGRVHLGPNAVLALAREGYRWRDIDVTDLRTMAGDPATWRLARRYWRTGAGEIVRSLSRRRFLRALQRLVPDLALDDLVPAGSGVRAQAVRPDGTLLDDFAFAGGATPGGARIVHVLNAPSPAATASLAIGRVVADRLIGPTT